MAYHASILRLALISLAVGTFLPPVRKTSLADEAPTGRVKVSLTDTESTEPGNDPITDELQFNRSVLQHMAGNHAAALSELPAVDQPAIRYYQAILLLETGRVDQAAVELGLVMESSSAPPRTPVYLAMAHLHGSRPAVAESVIRKYLKSNSADPFAHYLLGVALAHQDRVEGAVAQLTAAGVNQQTISNYRLASHERVASTISFHEDFDPYGADIVFDGYMFTQPEVLLDDCLLPRQRNWSLSLLFAYEYDSNVPLAPNFIGLGSNLVEREDSRLLAATFGEFLLVNQPDRNFGLIWSTIDTEQFDLDSFSVHDYMGGLYMNQAIGTWLLGVRYEFHETLLRWHHFADEHRLTPSVSFVGYDWGHTTAYYEYDRIDSNAPALIEEQAQSANVHGVGLTQAFYTFGGQGRLYAGYRYDHANADGSDFERDTHMATLRAELPLWRWIADAEARHFWDDYPNPNSLDFFERPRVDRRIEIRAGLQRDLGWNTTFRVDYTFVDNNSSVENLFDVRFYEYSRHIVSTQLIFDL